MIYEYVVRLLGKSIIKTLFFLPVLLNYEKTTLTVPLKLNNPITIETQELIKSGFNLKLEYYISIIINDKKLFRKHINKTVIWKEGWLVDGKHVEDKNLQNSCGYTEFSFNNFIFDENDHLEIFTKCRIIEDEDFTKSTGFKTSVLWNYYVPQQRYKYVYRNGEFVKVEN